MQSTSQNLPHLHIYIIHNAEVKKNGIITSFVDQKLGKPKSTQGHTEARIRLKIEAKSFAAPMLSPDHNMGFYRVDYFHVLRKMLASLPGERKDTASVMTQLRGIPISCPGEEGKPTSAFCGGDYFTDVGWVDPLSHLTGFTNKTKHPSLHRCGFWWEMPPGL